MTTDDHADEQVLFMDDMPSRHRAFTALTDELEHTVVTRTYDANSTIELLKVKEFDQVFLDHDLSEEDIMIEEGAVSKFPTGMDVVDFIMTMGHPPSEVWIHSCNGPAAARMAARLKGHPVGIHVKVVPFPALIMAMSQTLERLRKRE